MTLEIRRAVTIREEGRAWWQGRMGAPGMQVMLHSLILVIHLWWYPLIIMH